MGIEVRPIRTVEELLACEDLQAEVWGYGQREVVPKNELISAVRAGGVLLGAFDDEKKLVGFVYAIAGFDGKDAYLLSRLVGVKSGIRAKGLGDRLKRAQRDEALKLGYKQIRWMQDPLQAAQARLNLRKLGAVAEQYIVDYYGQTTSPLHGGIPTDRLELTWDLTSPRVQQRLDEPAASLDHEEPEQGGVTILATLPPEMEGAPSRPSAPADPPRGAKKLLIAAPTTLPQVLEKHKELAMEWRLAERDAFQRAFSRGYVATDFVVKTRGRADAFYVLTPASETVR